MDKSIPWDKSGRIETDSLKLTKEQAEAVSELITIVFKHGRHYDTLTPAFVELQKREQELRQQLGLEGQGE